MCSLCQIRNNTHTSMFYFKEVFKYSVVNYLVIFTAVTAETVK
jgi:hypothetical protein